MYPLDGSYFTYLGLFGLLCSVCVVAILQYLKPVDLKSSKYVMPPGPKGQPVLGNLNQMMAARRGGALAFNRWVSFRKRDLLSKQRESCFRRI
jgi:hypothetical protein